MIKLEYTRFSLSVSFYWVFSHNFETLYFSRVILGIAEAPFFIIEAKVYQLYFEDSKRRFTISHINTGPKSAQEFGPISLAALV
ncbi:MAG: hypothetical protein NTX05_09030 [Fusobacteria bacterium]|nr:hypothetical protein [Fusobacteriota bacterium]